MIDGLAIHADFGNHHSLEAAGAAAVAGADAAGAIWTGAAAVAGARFGAAGCFLAAVAGGRGAATGAVAVAAGGLAVAAVGGSGVMMLTGGVEAALGNSALVVLPVGSDGGSPAMSPAAAGDGAGGAFHDAA